jgi:ribokinase
VVLEARPASSGFFVLNAAPAMDLPAELLERCDLVIVNETEYELIPALATAKLVAVTYGKDGSAMFEHGRKVAEAPAAAVTWRTRSARAMRSARRWCWRCGRGFRLRAGAGRG